MGKRSSGSSGNSSYRSSSSSSRSTRRSRNNRRSRTPRQRRSRSRRSCRRQQQQHQQQRRYTARSPGYTRSRSRIEPGSGRKRSGRDEKLKEAKLKVEQALLDRQRERERGSDVGHENDHRKESGHNWVQNPTPAVPPPPPAPPPPTAASPAAAPASTVAATIPVPHLAPLPPAVDQLTPAALAPPRWGEETDDTAGSQNGEQASCGHGQSDAQPWIGRSACPQHWEQEWRRQEKPEVPSSPRLRAFPGLGSSSGISRTSFGGAEKRSCTAALGVLYWSEDGWDLSQRSHTPRTCRTCDSLVDAWRGRFDNMQITLRMCAAEGGGFKKYTKIFMAQSCKLSLRFHLPTYYQWLVSTKKKVLCERMVIGSILDYYHGKPMVDDRCGFRVQNTVGSWEHDLRGVAKTLQREAHENDGKFAALILDKHGKELRIEEMCLLSRQCHIERLLIILGGPTGIASGSEDQLTRVLEEFTDFPLLRCSLPGGIMHSYYALATLFVFHDQGVLLPFLTHMAQGSGRIKQRADLTTAATAINPAVAAVAAAIEQRLPPRTNCAEAGASQPDATSLPPQGQQTVPKPPAPPVKAASSGPPRARNALVPTPPSFPPPLALQARAVATVSKGGLERKAPAMPNFKVQAVATSVKHPEPPKAASGSCTPGPPNVNLQPHDMRAAPAKGTIAEEMQVASTETPIAGGQAVTTKGSIAQEFSEPKQNSVDTKSIEARYEEVFGSRAKAASSAQPHAAFDDFQAA
mmetsp:Transcript_13645/g.26369  ORF Transcript_13645/g.26369 Transcript_13645/m.26369 type:complete len:748 (-) Transcript_13645:66-2309(-)